MSRAIRSLRFRVVTGAICIISTAAALGVLSDAGAPTEQETSAATERLATMRGAEQAHVSILAELSAQHRRKASEIEALGRQRAALADEISALSLTRLAEMKAIADLEQRRRAAERPVTLAAAVRPNRDAPPAKKPTHAAQDALRASASTAKPR